MSDESPLSGNQAVEQIDGAKIRALRESKELTQLYVATAVGVTTDTISRWENRRYPTIKRENALKLAEVLEVELVDILDIEQHEAVAEEPPTVEPMEEALAPEPEEPVPGRWRCPPRAVVLLIIVVLLAGVWYLWQQGRGEVHEAVQVTAHRVLPTHVAPGQPFPVLIQVEANPSGTYSMIVRETVPQDCIVVSGLPHFATFDTHTGVIKWIGKSNGAISTFSYLARTKPAITAGEQLEFSGAVTLKRAGSSTTIDVDGPSFMEVKKLHWADANGDGHIDDEEILAVYDRLEIMDELGFGKSQSKVEEIWAGNGYRWDDASGTLVVIP